MKQWLMLTILLVNIVYADIIQQSQERVQQKLSYLLILKSSKSYSEAVEFAREFADTAQIKFVHESRQNAEIGLTYSKERCEDMSYPYPCHIARGGYDDGVYVSIEYADAYQGFRKGYYLVVVASGQYAPLIAKEIQKRIPDAYVKAINYDMGCDR